MVSGNDSKDKDRSEAHRALLESRSLDTGWNFALEELGRMNINFDPAWMSGKKQNWQNSLEFCEYRLHRVCLRKLLEWGWLFASACQNTIRSTLIPCNLQGKNFRKFIWENLFDHNIIWLFWKTFGIWPSWLPYVSNILSHAIASVLQVLHCANCGCQYIQHHDCRCPPLGCYQDRIPNNFVFSCW